VQVVSRLFKPFHEGGCREIVKSHWREVHHYRPLAETIAHGFDE
jgi:hypothetical protein